MASVRMQHLQTGVILGLVLVMFLVLSMVAVLSLRTALEEQVGSGLAGNARVAADRLDQFMWNRKGEVDLFSRLDFLQTASPGVVRAELDELQLTLPVFSWVGLTDPDGVVVAATGGILEGVSIAARPVFQMAREVPWFGDVHDAVLLAQLLPNPTGEPMRFVDVSFPVKGPDGSLRGVLAAHISWVWIQEVRSQFLAESEKTGADLLVLSAADRVFILGPQEVLGKAVAGAFLAEGSDRGWLVHREAGTDYLYGIARSRGYGDFPGFGWVVAVREPLVSAYRGLFDQQASLWVTGLGVTLVLSAAGWLVGKRITEPLQRLSRQSEALRLGARQLKLPRTGIQEIQQVADSLQFLANGLDAMKAVAAKDPLTDLANRLGTEEWLHFAIPLLEREGWDMVLLAMDLDHFKPINDTWGHEAGDAVLRWTADILRSTVRADELVARWGGDEFVVGLLVKNGGAEAAARGIGARIIARFSEPMLWRGSPCRVGCSLGAVRWQQEKGETWAGVQKRADEALYRAKRSGRNRMVWAS